MLVADEKVADSFTAPGDEIERMMYGWSVSHCLPTQLVEADSAAIGTVIRRDTVHALAGDSLPNTITVSRNAAGTILVNGGAVAVTGGTATVANTSTIQASAGGGDDSVTLHEANGVLSQAILSGGADDDLLVGGSGADSLFGQSGQDTVDGRGAGDFVSLSSGNDTALWSVGAGGDTVDGGADRDRLRLVGSVVDDRFSVGSDGTAVRVLHGASGALNDTDLRTVALDLAATAGGATGDGQRDRIAIAGGDGRADTITLTGPGVAPATIGDTFGVRAGEGTLDTIEVSTQAGGDLVDASQLPAALAALTVQGGADRDLLIGSAGADVLDGGEGDDRVLAGAGDDRLTAAAGIDEVDGDDGRDDLDAGLGDDAVTGGAGDDSFRWKAGDGSDRLERSAVTIPPQCTTSPGPA